MRRLSVLTATSRRLFTTTFGGPLRRSHAPALSPCHASVCLSALALLAALAGAAETENKNDPLVPLERRMAEMLNRDRAKEGLPPLAYDPKLAAVARAHSQDMRDNHFSDHVSPTTGKVADRVSRAKIPFRAVGENIARCGSIEAAQSALMMSEKHRANILSKEYTRFGVGIVLGEGGWPVCTQVFTQPPVARDVAALQTQALEEINAARLAKRLHRLVPDDALMRQALAHSERAARLGKFDPLWLEEDLTRDNVRWRIHEAAYYLTEKLAKVVASDLAMSGGYDSCGLAIVQAPLDSKAVGALWITLICAKSR